MLFIGYDYYRSGEIPFVSNGDDAEMKNDQTNDSMMHDDEAHDHMHEEDYEAHMSEDTDETLTSDTPNNEDSMEQDILTKYSRATLKTNMGDIVVEFHKDDSPNTVKNFFTLAADDFYDGVKFHRVIKDFMIQSGDPASKDDNQKDLWGRGGPGYTFEDEFNSHPLVKGSFAMANAGPNTNGSQFFIVTAESTPWLDGRHTNFGAVVEGLEVVEKIGNVETEGPDRPVENVVIEDVVLE